MLRTPLQCLLCSRAAAAGQTRYSYASRCGCSMKGRLLHATAGHSPSSSHFQPIEPPPRVSPASTVFCVFYQGSRAHRYPGRGLPGRPRGREQGGRGRKGAQCLGAPAARRSRPLSLVGSCHLGHTPMPLLESGSVHRVQLLLQSGRSSHPNSASLWICRRSLQAKDGRRPQP